MKHLVPYLLGILSIKRFYVSFALIILATGTSIVLYTSDNAHWVPIGLSKFLATFSLVLFACLGLKHSKLATKRAGVFLILALVFESFCDLFIERSFELGGVLSSIGLLFYILSFLQTTKIPVKKWILKALGFSVLLSVIFLCTQLIVLYFMGRSFAPASDGSFLVYMVLLSSASGIALASSNPSNTVDSGQKLAIIVFYISDFIVYAQVVFGLLAGLRIANALLYYGAQILYVYSAFYLNLGHQPSTNKHLRH